MKIRELINILDEKFPRSLSCSWDTDGLQFCQDTDKEVNRILVALDANVPEIEAAVNGGYDLLLTHHPLIFGGTSEINPDTLYGGRILRLASAGVSAASYHTRLDAGIGGVNDALVTALGFSGAKAFGDDEAPSLGRIVSFDEGIETAELCENIKTCLGTPSVRVSGGGIIRKLAIVGGAGKDFIGAARRAGADALLTGEVSYNAAIDAAEQGFTVIEAGHYYTEFPVCAKLAKLCADIAKAEVAVYGAPTQLCY